MNTKVIAKNIFHLYSLEADGKATKKKLKRAELLRFFANYPVSLISMEACGGAHYWARELTKQGHEVVLLNARYVKGFVVGNKNDFNDAQAIHEAVLRPNKRVVRVKTDAQQDMQLLHNIRQDLVDQRTAFVLHRPNPDPQFLLHPVHRYHWLVSSNYLTVPHCAELWVIV